METTNGNEAEIVGFRRKKHLGFTRTVIVKNKEYLYFRKKIFKYLS